MSVCAEDLSNIDFEQGEVIELSGNSGTEQFSNLQYFSTPAEFKVRLNALVGWASRTNLSTIYGMITLTEDISAAASIYSIDERITRFEDVLIRNIRVPRKYLPPVDENSRKRKSDSPEYTNIRGNFDLACRTPSSGKNPYMLEFVLYDCAFNDVVSRVKTFERFAEELELKAQVEIFHYTNKNTWTRKTKWSKRRHPKNGSKFLHCL